MNTNKEALQVTALCNGTVIDHIPADKLFAVVNLLDIPSMTTNVTIGYNLKSRKLGTKGLIKVADKFFTDEEVYPHVPDREKHTVPADGMYRYSGHA